MPSESRFREMVRFIAHGIGVGLVAALLTGKPLRAFTDIVTFRVMQYWGTFARMDYRSTVTHELIMRLYYPSGGR